MIRNASLRIRLSQNYSDKKTEKSNEKLTWSMFNTLCGEADRYFRYAVQSDPSDWWAHSLEISHSSKPSSHIERFTLIQYATFLVSMEQRKKATEIYLRTLESRPDYVHVLQELRELLVGRTQTQEVKEESTSSSPFSITKTSHVLSSSKHVKKINSRYFIKKDRSYPRIFWRQSNTRSEWPWLNRTLHGDCMYIPHTTNLDMCTIVKSIFSIAAKSSSSSICLYKLKASLSLLLLSPLAVLSVCAWFLRMVPSQSYSNNTLAVLYEWIKSQ